jgi:KUP system potassium uptake protein
MAMLALLDARNAPRRSWRSSLLIVGLAGAALLYGDGVITPAISVLSGYNPLAVAAVNGFFLVIDLIFVAANATKLIEGGWFSLLIACVLTFLILTWRTGWQLRENQRSSLRQREDEFIEWVLRTPPLCLPGAAAIFTAATTGIPLGLTHHLKHNRVLHERVIFLSSVNTDAPQVDPDRRVKLVALGAGISRVILHFGFMERPNVMEGLKLACRDPSLRGIDPEQITYYFRRVMVIPTGKLPGMAVWRKALFSAMHLNANLPGAYFGVPPAQVVEVGLEVEI